MNAVDPLKDGRVRLRLAERILTLAESGGQKTPVTPLLVTLFVGSALRRVSQGLSLDDRPQEVPEVFVDYLRQVNARPNPESPVSDDTFIRAAQTVATVSLGRNLVPQDFTPEEATEALKQETTAEQADVLLKRLIASGVIERRTPGGHVILRFNLDPAAEYLAAIRRLVDMRTRRAGPKEWQSYYRAYKREFSLPDVIFPWEETAEPTSSNSVSPPQKSATAAPRRPRRAKS